MKPDEMNNFELINKEIVKELSNNNIEKLNSKNKYSKIINDSNSKNSNKPLLSLKFRVEDHKQKPNILKDSNMKSQKNTKSNSQSLQILYQNSKDNHRNNIIEKITEN